MTARIVRATLEDLALVAALGRRTYTAHFADRWHGLDLAGWLDSQFGESALRADFSSTDVRYDLVILDDEPVGYAKTRADQPIGTQVHQRGLELQKIYFDAAVVGRGLGSMLLRHVLDRAGDQLVWLDVVQENTGARTLYERFDFAVVGETRDFAPNPRLAFWVMVRAGKNAPSQE